MKSTAGEHRKPPSKSQEMAIDDPLEKIKQIVTDGDSDPLGVALSIGGSASPIIGVLAAVKEALDGNQQGQRMRAAIIALADEINRLRDRWPKDLNAVFESDWFKETIKVLLKESADATKETKVVILARAAAHGCFPDTENGHRREDLASYIHDLAQLGRL